MSVDADSSGHSPPSCLLCPNESTNPESMDNSPLLCVLCRHELNERLEYLMKNGLSSVVTDSGHKDSEDKENEQDMDLQTPQCSECSTVHVRMDFESIESSSDPCQATKLNEKQEEEMIFVLTSLRSKRKNSETNFVSADEEMRKKIDGAESLLHFHKTV